MLFKRLAVILFCLSFFANKELSALSDFWYTGYHYDARQLLNHYKISDAFQSQHIEDKINGINWCYLNHQYDSMNMLFKQAIGQAKSTGSLDQLYKLYNLHVERNHFAGRYYYAEKCLKTYLKEVPDNYSVASFLRLNRIKLLTKSFSLQGSLVSQFELDSLQKHFRQIQAYKAYIETVVFDYTKNSITPNLNHYLALMRALPSPYNQIGLMNLYYQAKAQLRETVVLKQLDSISANDYLSYFRLHIALATESINDRDSSNASKEMALCFPFIAYLADIEVSRHYTGVFEDFIMRFEGHPNAPIPIISLRDYDHEGRLLASNEIARDLLHGANEKLAHQQLMNLYFRIFSVVIAVVLSIVLAFYLSAHNKLKQANIQREWFITALSHDLRSPLSHIARSIDDNNDPDESKRLLVQFEYLLNDTLEMAVDAKKNKPAQYEMLDLVELLDATLLDLDFIFKHMRIQVHTHLPNDCMVKGNSNGLKVLIRNVLLNAAKHNYPSGTIDVTVSSDKPKSIVVENSVLANSSIEQDGTGTHLINYFSSRNEVLYRLSISGDIAKAELIFID